MSSDKQLVTRSYGTCCIAPEFFNDFYDNFASASPKIGEKFKQTDMARQKKLLREGITYMVMFADGSSIAERKVRGLGESHSQSRLDIEPGLYELWVNALLKTIAKHDKAFNPELDKAWRRVLGKGIELMKSMYKSPQPVAV